VDGGESVRTARDMSCLTWLVGWLAGWQTTLGPLQSRRGVRSAGRGNYLFFWTVAFFSFLSSFLSCPPCGMACVVMVTVAYRLSLGLGVFFVRKQKNRKVWNFSQSYNSNKRGNGDDYLSLTMLLCFFCLSMASTLLLETLPLETLLCFHILSFCRYVFPFPC